VHVDVFFFAMFRRAQSSPSGPDVGVQATRIVEIEGWGAGR